MRSRNTPAQRLRSCGTASSRPAARIKPAGVPPTPRTWPIRSFLFGLAEEKPISLEFSATTWPFDSPVSWQSPPRGWAVLLAPPRGGRLLSLSVRPVPVHSGHGGSERRRRGRRGAGTGAAAAAAARGPAERPDHERAQPGAAGARSVQVRRAQGTSPRPRSPPPSPPPSPRRGRHHWVPATQRLFGGQIVGQALVAAARAVSRAEQVHSLHCYFVRAGASGPGEPGRRHRGGGPGMGKGGALHGSEW